MPLLHCHKCQYVWEGRKNSKCDWCGKSGVILEEETSFEKFCKWVTSKEGKEFVRRVSNIRHRGTSIY
jgi:hypothetical protein